MYSTRPSIPGTTYRLLEAIPYPRAERQGRLVDASGTRLHGAYERKVAGGYQSALINNGRVLCRYVYGRPTPATFPGDRHSYANLVLCGGYSWGVPDDSNPPISHRPATEHIPGWHRGLWDSHFIKQRLLAGLKPTGSVHGAPEQVTAWCAEAKAAGLLTRKYAHHAGAVGTIAGAGIARPGPALIGGELQNLYDNYDGLLPDYVIEDALNELECLSGEDLLCRDLANPADAQDLIITGHAYGYPPMTTVACIFGTHS